MNDIVVETRAMINLFSIIPLFGMGFCIYQIIQSAYLLREICAEIALCYEIEFLKIGTDQDHVHFLVQSVPKSSPTQIVRTIKSITAKKIFQ